jgi:hypothetical protein
VCVLVSNSNVILCVCVCVCDWSGCTVDRGGWQAQEQEKAQKSAASKPQTQTASPASDRELLARAERVPLMLYAIQRRRSFPLVCRRGEKK